MRTDVLDHGYVQLVEHWGSDERIIEAARMSTNKGFLGWGPKVHYVRQCTACMIIEDEPGGQDSCPGVDGPHRWEEDASVRRVLPGDEKLLRYLWKHKHATPFEMAGMIVEVQAPIFVFREWHRHRTQSYNEMSARYTPLPDVNYMPTDGRCLAVSAANKQAGKATDAGDLTHESVLEWLAELEEAYRIGQYVYESGLKRGIPKEVARLPVPVGRYSRMRASANLRNWLAFLTLRMDAAAQWEIRQYADAVGGMVAEMFPRTWALFAEGR